MSPNVHVLTDAERLVVLEEKVDGITRDVCELSSKTDAGFQAMDKKIDAFIASADDRYASKLVEHVVYAFIALVLTAFVTGVLALVVK